MMPDGRATLRGQAAEVLRWAERAAGHWEAARAGAASAPSPSSCAARPPVGEGLPRGDRGVRGGAGAGSCAGRGERGRGDRPQQPRRCRAACGRQRAAERDYGEALRIAQKINYREGVATYTGNLADLALDREQWPEAERLAREALALAEKIGRAELVGSDCYRIAIGLLRQAAPPRRCPSPAARWRSWRSCATRIWTRAGGAGAVRGGGGPPPPPPTVLGGSP